MESCSSNLYERGRRRSSTSLTVARAGHSGFGLSENSGRLGKTRLGSEFGRADGQFSLGRARAARAFGRPSWLGRFRALGIFGLGSGARNTSSRQVTPPFSPNHEHIFCRSEKVFCSSREFSGNSKIKMFFKKLLAFTVIYYTINVLSK